MGNIRNVDIFGKIFTCPRDEYLTRQAPKIDLYILFHEIDCKGYLLSIKQAILPSISKTTTHIAVK